MRFIFSGIAFLGGLLRRVYWYSVYHGFRRTYEISNAFRFNGYDIQMYGPGRIRCGGNSYIGEHSTVQAYEACTVEIGPDCKISHNVRIYSQSANADSDFVLGRLKVVMGDVKIGAGCWIGANVFIGPGITLGEGVVIGANSVVTRDVPAKEIWGGVPARLIRSKIEL